MGAALAMAEGAASIGSAGRADKATIAVSEAVGPKAHGRAEGAGAKGHCVARPGIGLMNCYERATKRLLSQKEWDIIRGTDKMGPTEGGACQNTERMQLGKGYSPLETIEKGICYNMGKKRPCKGCQQAGVNKSRRTGVSL